MEPYAYSNHAYRRFNQQDIPQRSQAVAQPVPEDNLSFAESALLMTAFFTLITSILAIATL